MFLFCSNFPAENPQRSRAICRPQFPPGVAEAAKPGIFCAPVQEYFIDLNPNFAPDRGQKLDSAFQIAYFAPDREQTHETA
jgi:hypothetical protein